ncbi:MAG: potassium channel family protein [Thermoleophilia bacterium]|nr:potassium channel family protein [Thermoleophilia bacterium]MDH3724232.1 potassium channel family protein [Thermoleophilia bacterium]
MEQKSLRDRLRLGRKLPETPGLSIPRHELSPTVAIGRRMALALALIVFVAAVAWVNRDGYIDPQGNSVGVLEVFYYSTVSITTAGYGDIVPTSDSARLATIFFVTPARVIFLIVLVGTTLEVLTERTRERYRERRWRAHVKDHYIIAGYGVKGKSAVRVLTAQEVDPSQIVVIDSRPEAIAEANSSGLVGILGNASSTAVLEDAGIQKAKAIVVAPQADDSAVLITLTARQLNRGITLVAAAREAENAQLLRQSGANSVITSSEAAGRLLGLATRAPRLVRVLEELATLGEGLDIGERPLAHDEIGSLSDLRNDQLVVAIVRRGELLRFDDSRAQRTEAGDRIVFLHSNKAEDDDA